MILTEDKTKVIDVVGMARSHKRKKGREDSKTGRARMQGRYDSGSQARVTWRSISWLLRPSVTRRLQSTRRTPRGVVWRRTTWPERTDAPRLNHVTLRELLVSETEAKCCGDRGDRLKTPRLDRYDNFSILWEKATWNISIVFDVVLFTHAQKYWWIYITRN